MSNIPNDHKGEIDFISLGFSLWVQMLPCAGCFLVSVFIDINCFKDNQQKK